jgi:hypothetical protein
MYGRRRYPLVFALLLFAVASAGAETLAISVRLVSGPADEPGLIPLLATIEEGVMETMFARGHIVFDIDLDGATDSSRYQAVDLARAGGATFLVLVDVAFELVPGRGLIPSMTQVTVVEVDSARDLSAGSVNSGLLASSDGSPPDVLALNVGTEAAENALSEIGEVGSAW